MNAPYSGRVHPGGGWTERAIVGGRICKLSVSEMDNNVYLVQCQATGRALLIDAADDARAILAMIDATCGRSQVDWLVTTHRHLDHVRALVEVSAALPARTAAGESDAPALPVPPDRLLRHGDQIRVGELRLDVIGLRGHTPGSIALTLAAQVPGESWTHHAFTGDSLFPGGVGNTDGDSARFNQLISDVSERVFAVLPDSTWVYPGHGADTTLAAERDQLPLWRARGW